MGKKKGGGGARGIRVNGIRIPPKSRLIFADEVELAEHVEILQLSINAENAVIIDLDLAEALEYFLFDVSIKPIDVYSVVESAGLPQEYNYEVTASRPDDRTNIVETGSSYEEAGKNYYRDLQIVADSINRLAHYINTINDPVRKNADVRAVKAYLSSFEEFLSPAEILSGGDAVPMPRALPGGLKERLQWFRRVKEVSEDARQWCNTIVKFIEVWLKL